MADVHKKRPRKYDASHQRVQLSEHRAKIRKSEATKFEQEEAPPAFQQLKPRTREISQAIVKSKWTSLPAPAQNQVRELIKAAVRPVILSQKNERRRAEVETALNTLVKKLERRVPRMPFPPRTKDSHFDLDKLLERNRILESQLTPVTHSLDLLRASIEQEQVALAADRRTYAKLEANSKAEERQQRQQLTKTHPLLKRPHYDVDIYDDAETINLVSERSSPTFDLEVDPALKPLVQQLRSHLESIKTNQEQIKGVSEAMSSAFATLDSALQQGGMT